VRIKCIDLYQSKKVFVLRADVAQRAESLYNVRKRTNFWYA